LTGKPNNRQTIFWFRRDLRLFDNAGLFHALAEQTNVLPLFIFDSTILDELTDRADPRVQFIHTQVMGLKDALEKKGSSMLVKSGVPLEVFEALLSEFDIEAVYTNHDYEPYATERDAQVGELLATKNVAFKTYKDQVIFEKGDVLKGDDTPYTVYTPYMRKWKILLKPEHVQSYEVEEHADNWALLDPLPGLTLEQVGFNSTSDVAPEPVADKEILERYQRDRDTPSLRGTTRLGLHLRFGTVSIRAMAREGLAHSDTWLNELIWREFFMTILWHFPRVVSRSFKAKYDNIRWRNDKQEFEKWCRGETGYPIVDAGMRELNQTGFMHNRVRMVVASFLTKHLLIDWRWGEAYFAEKLLDYELSANNGNWQWAAGCGCDAAPYFRVFNPDLQTKKFDPQHLYIKKWVPEYQELTYPRPMVEHKMARERALSTYKEGLSQAV